MAVFELDGYPVTNMQQPNVFMDPAEHFSLRVPEGWSADTSGQQGESVVLFGPTVDDDFRANVNVIVQEIAPWTPEEYVTLSRLQLKKLSNLATLPVDEPAPRLPGGWVLEWTTWEAPIPVRGRQLIAFRAGRAFVVTGTATAASFARHEPLFRAVFDSFQFLGDGPARPFEGA